LNKVQSYIISRDRVFEKPGPVAGCLGLDSWYKKCDLCAELFHEFLGKYIWTDNSPVLNPMDFSFWHWSGTGQAGTDPALMKVPDTGSVYPEISQEPPSLERTTFIN